MTDGLSAVAYFDLHVMINLLRYQAAQIALSRGAEEAARPADTLVAAMNAAVPAYHFADHLFFEFARLRPKVVYRTSELRRYRAYLDEFRCVDTISGAAIPDLALLGAVVDTYKHAELTKASRPVIAPHAFARIGQLPGETVSRVVVIQDGKPERSLLGIIENVVAMWQTELTTHGLREAIGNLGAGNDRTYRY